MRALRTSAGLLAALAAIWIAGAVNGAEPPLPLVFEDDFRESPAERYIVQHNVEWIGGRATVMQGGLLIREQPIGRTAELECDLDFGTALRKGETQEARVGILHVKRFATVAAIGRTQRAEGAAWQVRILAVTEDDQEKVQESVVRTFPIPGEVPAKGRWRLRYQWGLLEVFAGEKRVAIGDTGLGMLLPVNGFSLQPAAGQIHCRKLALRATPAPPKLTATQIAARQTLGPKYLDALEEANDLFKQETLAQYLAAAEECLKLAQQVFGNESSEALDVKMRMALAHSILGREGEALKIYSEIRTVRLRDQGPRHPATAAVLRDLGECQRKLGQFAVARPNLEMAFAAFDDALGRTDPQTSLTLDLLVDACEKLHQPTDSVAYAGMAIQAKGDVSDDPRSAMLLWDKLVGIFERAQDYRAAAACARQMLAIQNMQPDATGFETAKLQAKAAELDGLSRLDADLGYAGGPLASLGLTKAAGGEYESAFRVSDLVLTNERRGDWQRQALPSGAVVWHDNQAMLTGPARISVARPACYVVEFRFTLAAPEMNAAGGETRFGLTRDLGEMGVAITPPAAAGQPVKLRVYERVRQQEKLTERTLREFPLAGAIAGKWALKYRHGLLQVFRDEQEVAIGATDMRDLAAAMHGAFIEQRQGSLSVSELAVTTDQPRPELGDPELAPDLDAYDLAARKSIELFEAEDYFNCLTAVREAAKLSSKLFGENASQTLLLRRREAECMKQLLSFPEAEAILTDVLARTKRHYGEQHPDTAQTLLDLGVEKLIRGNANAAIPHLESAHGIYRHVLGDGHKQSLLAKQSLALCLFSAGRMAEAAAQYESAIAQTLTTFGSGSEGEAFLRYQMGVFLAASARFPEAIAELSTSRRLYSKLLGTSDTRTLDVVLSLADTNAEAGDYAVARALFEDAIRQFQQTQGKQDSHTIHATMRLAYLSVNHGDHEYSHRLCEQAVSDLASRNSYQQRDLNAFHLLGESFELLGELERARTAFQRVIDLMPQFVGQDHPHYLNAQAAYARFEIRKGDHVEGERLLLSMLPKQVALLEEWHLSAASTHSHLAIAADRRGDFGQSARYRKRSIEIYERAYGQADYRTLLERRDLGATLIRGDDPNAGISEIKSSLDGLIKALGPNHALVADTRIFLSWSLRVVGDWKAAHELDIDNGSHRIALARELLPVLPESSAMLHVRELRDAQEDLLKIPRFIYHHDSAAVEQSTLKTRPRIHLPDVYRIVWNTRAIATRSVARRVPAGAEQTPEVQAASSELRQVRSSLTTLLLSDTVKLTPDARREEVARLTERKEQLQFKLATVSGKYRDQATAESATFEQLAELLPPDAVLIDILQSRATRTETQTIYEAFILRPQAAAPGYSLVWIEIGESGPIDDAVAIWQQASGVRGGTPVDEPRTKPVAWQEAGATLSRLVWQKLSPHVQGAKTLLIVGEGNLTRVPWHAIPGDQSGRLLMEDYAIGTALFGQHVVELLRREPATGDEFLAVGDVDYGAAPGRRKWDALSQTAVEADQIAALWKSWGKTTVLKGKAPTEAEVSAALSKARYIHLATHGFFAESKLPTPFQVAGARGGPKFTALAAMPDVYQPALRNPLALTGLVLAGANAPPAAEGAADGILTGEELDSLDLSRADLVVLSACETGLGQIAASEGVLGLQRTLHLQGARTVIGSLWKVDDAATRALMIEFYRNLWEKKLPRLEALRQAQLAMLHHYDLQKQAIVRPAAGVKEPAASRQTPPFYWAAFMLSGDWR